MRKIILLVCLVFAFTASAETLVIPSVAHAPGANGSFWKTAIGVYNASSAVQTISARSLIGEGDVPTVELQPGYYVNTDDLGAMFNAGDGTFLVEITRSDPSVLFTARTYSLTNDQPGEVSTLLLPISPIDQPATVVFSRIEGARKALFLSGSLTADCIAPETTTVYVYFGTVGELNRFVIPDNIVACKVTVQGLPSGWENTLSYAWGSEADNVTNCPTLIRAE